MVEEIRQLIAKHCKMPTDVVTLSDTTDLYAAGLSSFASVQLMLALENHYDIEFPETMLNRKTFSSIAAIEAALKQIVPAGAAA